MGKKRGMMSEDEGPGQQVKVVGGPERHEPRVMMGKKSMGPKSLCLC